MSRLTIWALILGNVALALTANATATIWAGRENKVSVLLVMILIVSPIVFLSFGLVSAKLGLAVGSAVIDSLLTISSIALGLILFGGWRDVTLAQWVGMGLAVAGIVLMQFGKR